MIRIILGLVFFSSAVSFAQTDTAQRQNAESARIKAALDLLFGSKSNPKDGMVMSVVKFSK